MAWMVLTVVPYTLAIVLGAGLLRRGQGPVAGATAAGSRGYHGRRRDGDGRDGSAV